MASELKAVFTAKKTAFVDRKKEQFEALVRLQAEAGSAHVRMPLSIVAVIDRSGSMGGGRVEAAKACTIDLVKRLHSDDEIGIVVYDQEITTLLPLTSVTTAQALIEPLMNAFEARGSTDLHGGWLAGAALLAPRTGANRVCRVILLSDGHANHGVTDGAAITAQVAQLAQAGVSTTTVGIGLGFNEELMSGMATAGHGSALFGERPQDLVQPFESELGLLSNLAGREVTMRIVGSVGGAEWRLHNSYPHDITRGWTLPSIAVGSEAWAAVSMPMDKLMRARRRREAIVVHVEFSYTDAQGEARCQTATWDLSAAPLLSGSEYDRLPVEELVVRRFNELAVAEILTSARAAVIEGDWKAVEKMLADVRKRAESNAWLESIVTELERMLKARDAARMRKEMHFGVHAMRSRLAATHEIDAVSDSGVATFLHRRSVQGRKSDLK